jgi:hypothetical protein
MEGRGAETVSKLSGDFFEEGLDRRVHVAWLM